MDRLTHNKTPRIAELAVCRDCTVYAERDSRCLDPLENVCDEWSSLLVDAVKKLAAYEDAAPLEKVQEWARAEGEGRLVVLPAKENQQIWRVIEEERCASDCWGDTCANCNAGCKETFLRVQEGRFSALYDTADFGKTVFLSRAEAEEATK